MSKGKPGYDGIISTYFPEKGVRREQVVLSVPTVQGMYDVPIYNINIGMKGRVCAEVDDEKGLAELAALPPQEIEQLGRLGGRTGAIVSKGLRFVISRMGNLCSWKIEDLKRGEKAAKCAVL